MKLYPTQTQQPQVHKDKVVTDIAELIRRLPLTGDQIKGLYSAITGRMVNKTCYYCGKLAPEVEGTHTYPGGDMSRPKQFICGGCSK